jgi:hypothetical protein
MLSQIIRTKRWFAIIAFGVVFGLAFYGAVNLLPSQYVDLLYYAFGLQYAAAVLLIDVGSALYFIASVAHFSILSWVTLKLMDKHLSVNRWLMIGAGYLTISVLVCLSAAYVFFHYVMDIGGALPIQGK